MTFKRNLESRVPGTQPTPWHSSNPHSHAVQQSPGTKQHLIMFIRLLKKLLLYCCDCQLCY